MLAPTHKHPLGPVRWIHVTIAISTARAAHPVALVIHATITLQARCGTPASLINTVRPSVVPSHPSPIPSNKTQTASDKQEQPEVHLHRAVQKALQTSCYGLNRPTSWSVLLSWRLGL